MLSILAYTHTAIMLTSEKQCQQRQDVEIRVYYLVPKDLDLNLVSDLSSFLSILNKASKSEYQFLYP